VTLKALDEGLQIFFEFQKQRNHVLGFNLLEVFLMFAHQPLYYINGDQFLFSFHMLSYDFQ